MFATLAACAPSEQRYRVLSFFFDGVPPPVTVETPIPAPADESSELAGVTRPAPVEWTIHEPDCDDCHLRDASNALIEPRERLCWECHDPEDFEAAYEHGPFAAGACVQCHTPHRSPRPYLLRYAPEELCSTCHDASTFAEVATHRAERGDECLACHDPHAAPYPALLKDAPERP